MASPWWRIAGANGMTLASDAALQAGQTVSVPMLALNTHNADSLRPYDPSRSPAAWTLRCPCRATFQRKYGFFP